VITTVELFVLLSPHGSVIDMTIVFNLMLYWIWNPYAFTSRSLSLTLSDA
jgi:hypothetical protein